MYFILGLFNLGLFYGWKTKLSGLLDLRFILLSLHFWFLIENLQSKRGTSARKQKSLKRFMDVFFWSHCLRGWEAVNENWKSLCFNQQLWHFLILFFGFCLIKFFFCIHGFIVFEAESWSWLKILKQMIINWSFFFLIIVISVFEHFCLFRLFSTVKDDLKVMFSY